MKNYTMTQESQLIFYLKSHNINLKDFDYKENKTTDKYKENHPFIQYGRRYYQNPYLWTRLIERKLQEGIDFIFTLDNFKPDYQIIKATLSGAYINEKVTLKMIERCLSDKDNDQIEIDCDNILVGLVEANSLNLFKKTVEIAKKNNIKPRYEKFANAGNGAALVFACDIEKDNKFADYLLNQGADATLNNGLAFPKACKKGKYGFALKLMDKGVSLHTRHDLGLKMILRNDKIGYLPEGEEENRKILLSRYKKEEENIG